LETALAKHASKLEVDMVWRPFQLDSSLPKGRGKRVIDAYTEKFGPQMVESMVPRMKAVGKEVGINFSYGGYIGNTFDSHRFIWQSRETGGSAMQDKMVEALFAAYFEEEKSMGDPDVLRACAEKAGMPSEITEKLLNDPRIGEGEVEKERKHFRNKWNCTGVPLFIVDGRFPLSGAQPAEAFDIVFEDILEE